MHSSAPPVTSWATCRPRTGSVGTSGSSTATAARSPRSPATGRAWTRPGSSARTTTSCGSPRRSTSRCARSWSPAPSASRSWSGRTPATSESARLAGGHLPGAGLLGSGLLGGRLLRGGLLRGGLLGRRALGRGLLGGGLLGGDPLRGRLPGRLLLGLVLDVLEVLRAGLAPTLLGGVDRALQCGQQVDDLAGGLGRGRGALELAALDLGLDQGLDRLGVVVLELARVEVTGQRLDQHVRHLHLGRLDVADLDGEVRG